MPSMVMGVVLAGGWPFALAVPTGLLAPWAAGFINGARTLRFSIPSFITTLGMLYVARSLTVVISGGFPPVIPAGSMPRSMSTAFIGPADLFRMSFIWFVIMAVLIGLTLSPTDFGNRVPATRGFLAAAQSMGIPTARVKIACFMICSVLAGFAGALQVMRLGAPLPPVGEGLELQAVAAAVIGGTTLTGGIGPILGGIVGAILIRVIDNGQVLSRVDANWFKMALGALTVFAVLMNVWLRAKTKRVKVETSR